MSLPSELRVLCFQLSSTPISDLPGILPTLQSYVLRCQAPLSSHASNTAKAEASASSALIHKLKIQLSSLINGRSSEGRFAAVVLIKDVVEVGGWEVLRGSESWVRGLLSLLGKPDALVSKELSIVTLTKIYCMTHRYPTLIREITTPTLPGFIASCLNLISNSSSESPTVTEAVFRSFATLLPHHTTIYRPFASQIRNVTRPYLAPSLSDGRLVPCSLKGSARHLVVILHQTVAKNGGGEEWGKAVCEAIKSVHGTADIVFRAVVEDWESTAGYVSGPVDVNQEIGGGGKTPDDFPAWTGIFSGTDRLTGLLELLAHYFQYETSTPVCIPLAAILDMLSRILSIAVPLVESSTGQGSARLHPAIDRDERDGLWCGMPQIHVSALNLVGALAERLQDSFAPVAPGMLDQLVWLFPFGKNTPEFRVASYTIAAKILEHAGQSFDKSQVGKFGQVIRACCNDILPLKQEKTVPKAVEGVGKKQYYNGSTNQNADIFFQSKEVSAAAKVNDTNLTMAAKLLLPLFLSHLPQQYLDISLRSFIERTAISSHHKNAMVASILNPFVGKNGKALASILPHLSRQFGSDDVVEMLLRPRMPVLSPSGTRPRTYDALDVESEDEEVISNKKVNSIPEGQDSQDVPWAQPASNVKVGQGLSKESPIAQDSLATPTVFGTTASSVPVPSSTVVDNIFALSQSDARAKTKVDEDVNMNTDEDSDDESVHLTMQLDTDSESD